jgi:hypothetical protein
MVIQPKMEKFENFKADWKKIKHQTNALSFKTRRFFCSKKIKLP